MAAVPKTSTLLVIGDNSMLTYLLRRYAEESGCRMVHQAAAPRTEEIRQLKPAAVIFSSIQHLQLDQLLVEDLSVCEIPVLVCASLADEALAQELGADACLMHPLTYENFLGALTSVYPDGPAKSGFRAKTSGF